MKPVDEGLEARWLAYFDARDDGYGVGDAAKRAGIDRTTAYRFERMDLSSTGIAVAHKHDRLIVGGTIVAAPISPDAATALTDFATFRLRYMGRRSTPWQTMAAEKVAELLRTQDREYAVINMPPGSGKSTLFTHDIPAWLIAQDRTIRIQIGSRTERQARMYVGRLKRTLERDAPLRNDPDDVAAGRVFNAEACLADDFGSFKPEGRSDLWRHEALVVRQTTGQALDDKEPTVSAWGQDSGFLGGRFDVVVWDDLVDRRNTKTEDASLSLREWYSTEAETRLEPGGLLILQGQRIAADDLYRYALDLTKFDDTKKYHHIVFPAHHDDTCADDHGPDAKPYPEGCLLDPYRLPHQMLRTIADSEPRTYNLMYQQRDDIVVGGLCQPAWLEGGVDDEGHLAPGCYDTERALLEIPPGINPATAFSFLSIDPSPTEYWGIIWWLYDGDTQRLNALNLKRTRLTPEQFLGYDIDTGQFSGLLHDWWMRSAERNHPINHVILEINAAQRWLVTQPHVQRWQTNTGVTIIPHQTNRNKNDAEYGLETLGSWFKNGLFRLPTGDAAARIATHHLTDEALKYPNHKTTDMLMSAWFATLAVRTSYTPSRDGMYSTRGPYPNARRGLNYRR